MYPVSACKKFSKHHLSIECSCPDFENGQHVWLKCNVFLWQTGLRINTYTYLMLISRSIKFQSELSGGGII